MGISASTAAMAFGSGLIKGDEKARLENLKIHSDKLAAKRDAIISMKKSKYEYDLTKYEGNKTKMDALNAVSNDLNTGKFDYQIGDKEYVEGKITTDTFALGEAYLRAKHGLDYFVKLKTSKMGAESDPTAWIEFVKQAGNNPNIKHDLKNIDFKSRNVMESNYLESIQKIEDKYAAQLKNVKHDSPLVNAILGKKKEEIAALDIDVEQDKKDVKTIESATTYITKKADDETITDIVEEERTFADSDASLFLPKTFKDEVKEEGTKVKDKLTNIDKDVVQTTYEIIKTETGSKDKDFVKFDSNTKQATSFTENGQFLNDQLKNLQIQIVDSMTPNYIFTTYNTTDANDVYRYLSKGDVQNILKTRVENYTGAESSEFIKKGVFSERESFIGFVPFSIVNLNDEFIIGTEGVSLKNADKKNIGKRYKDAVKLYVLNNYSHKNEQGVPVFNDNRTEQYWMNKIQNDLIKIKPNSKTGIYSSEIADEIKTNMGLIKDKTVTTKGSPTIISEDKTIQVVKYAGNEIKLTEKSKKQFEKDGIDWTELEVVNTIASEPESKKLKETKIDISDVDSDETAGEYIDPWVNRMIAKATDGTITDIELIELGNYDLTKVPANLRVKYWRAKNKAQVEKHKKDRKKPLLSKNKISSEDADV